MEAADGYRVVMALAELDPASNGRVGTLALDSVVTMLISSDDIIVAGAPIGRTRAGKQAGRQKSADANQPKSA